MADKVTTVGAGVDAVVRRIARAYEVRGMLEKLTSYDAAAGGSALNEVLFEYDSAGLLSKEYQEHGGTKDGETLYVQYNYDQTASSGVFTKGLRPTSVRYPNARLVHTTYGTTGSPADALARIAAINADDSGSPGDALSEYTYLGLGTIVTEDYPEPDVKLDYIGDGSYSGFDRFGRVVDQKWYDYGASAVRDQYTYGYDRASNRLYRENTTAGGKDEFYGYDAINRLVAFDRGDLNAEKTAISGTPVREEDWTLDPLGNWPGYVQKTSGTTDLDQDRTHNKGNEIAAITATTGTDWADPVHDRAGNMTTVPKPSSLADGLTCTYDAWNRLVEVQDGETTVGRYEYDALNRRIKKHLDSQAPDEPDGIDTYVHYFYNRDWQVLETRETTTESAEPEDLQPKHQHIWSLRYIDAPVLRDENTDQDNLCDDERLYYLADANFNITTLTDTNGDAIERYLYTPYGAATIYDATWSSPRPSSLYTNPYLYTGRELDPEFGLYHYRTRWYSAQVGQFLCRDWKGHAAGDPNVYRYVLCAPTNHVDAFGLDVNVDWIEDLFGIDVSELLSGAEADWQFGGGSDAFGLNGQYTLTGSAWAKSGWTDAGQEKGEVWAGYYTKNAGAPPKCKRRDLFRQYTLQKRKRLSISVSGYALVKPVVLPNSLGVTVSGSVSFKFADWVKAEVTFTGTRFTEWVDIAPCPCDEVHFQPFDDDQLQALIIGACFASGVCGEHVIESWSKSKTKTYDTWDALEASIKELIEEIPKIKPPIVGPKYPVSP